MHVSTHNNRQFPFKSVLSLRLLIEYWEKAVSSGAVPAFVGGITDMISAASELREPITDLAVLDRHRELVNFLMTAAIPAANQETEISAATVPFQFNSFFATDAFKKTLTFEKIEEGAKINIPGG